MKSVLVLGLLLLTGCAGMSYAMTEYSGVKVNEIETKHDKYRIFDKPEQGKMMVTSSIGHSMGQGLAKGITLNSVDSTPPKPLFQEAARAWLDQTGRKKCKITDGYLIISPQFEFTYSC